MFSPNGVKNILFDLDGTLRHNRPSFNQAFFDFARKLGVPDDTEIHQHAMRWFHYYWAQSPELLADLETFAEQRDLFWMNHSRLHLLATGCPPEQAEALAPELYRCMEEEYTPEDWVPPEVPWTLQALKDGGFRLAVVSNRTHSYEEQLETLGLHGYFEFALAAGEVNAWKPDPAIFEYALRQLEAKPSETLYVGDNYFADVVGARRAGLGAVLLDAEGTFPQADCPVIHTLSELGMFLEK